MELIRNVNYLKKYLEFSDKISWALSWGRQVRIKLTICKFYSSYMNFIKGAGKSSLLNALSGYRWEFPFFSFITYNNDNDDVMWNKIVNFRKLMKFVDIIYWRVQVDNLYDFDEILRLTSVQCAIRDRKKI